MEEEKKSNDNTTFIHPNSKTTDEERDIAIKTLPRFIKNGMFGMFDERDFKFFAAKNMTTDQYKLSYATELTSCPFMGYIVSACRFYYEHDLNNAVIKDYQFITSCELLHIYLLAKLYISGCVNNALIRIRNEKKILSTSTFNLNMVVQCLQLATQSYTATATDVFKNMESKLGAVIPVFELIHKQNNENITQERIEKQRLEMQHIVNSFVKGQFMRWANNIEWFLWKLQYVESFLRELEWAYDHSDKTVLINEEIKNFPEYEKLGASSKKTFLDTIETRYASIKRCIENAHKMLPAAFFESSIESIDYFNASNRQEQYFTKYFVFKAPEEVSIDIKERYDEDKNTIKDFMEYFENAQKNGSLKAGIQNGLIAVSTKGIPTQLGDPSLDPNHQSLHNNPPGDQTNCSSQSMEEVVQTESVEIDSVDHLIRPPAPDLAVSLDLPNPN